MATVEKQLLNLPSLSKRVSFLAEKCPSLCILVLKGLKRPKILDVYTESCKKREKDPYKYSLYVHGYLIPWFNSLRESGETKDSVNKSISIGGEQFEYKGHIDKKGQACGFGKASSRGASYVGTFLADVPHGFCKYSCWINVWCRPGSIMELVRELQKGRRVSSWCPSWKGHRVRPIVRYLAKH